METITIKDVSDTLGDYNILHKLGSGSYSTVFKGKHLISNQYVAIKCVEKAKLSQSGRDNIINEIQIMKMINHPFIVKLLDFQWDLRFIYLILEYCNGGDLSGFIRKRRRLPEKILKKFFCQLALALQFLRSQDISHLDLKPQNLLLCRTPSLTLKVADFGFAQLLSDDAHKSSIRGSPLYMAPEMLLKRNYTAKADLWSVGIIAYECLFGNPPFSTSNCCELIDKMRNEFPIEIPDGVISLECYDLLSRLLVYDAYARINFDDFFNHPFIDLEHYPKDSSYTKAVTLIHEAVKLDYNKSYKKAFNKYCQALRYLVPYVNELEDVQKKESLQSKVLEYCKRAEELKTVFQKRPLSPVLPDIEESEVCSTYESAQFVKYDSIAPLDVLCTNTPAMKDALDMGVLGTMYLAEGDFVTALNKLKLALSVLVPTLKVEPPGIRKKKLKYQVEEWLTVAESVKAIVDAGQTNTQEVVQDNCENCILQ